MTEINGKLIEKKLVLDKICPNQGEAGSVQLVISLEPIQDIKYYLEFLCPYGRKYLSKEVGVEKDKIIYVIPTCVFLVAGKVYVQIVGRSADSIVIKSTKSADASIEIKPSINGLEHSEIEHQDFVSYAESAIANAGEMVEMMQQKNALAEQKLTQMDNLFEDINQKLSTGEIEGKSAYRYALENGYNKTEQEFGQQLAKIGEKIEDAPDNKTYARQKDNWVQTAKIPLPNMQSVGKVIAVQEGEQGAEYGLVSVADSYYSLDIDAKELESFARHSGRVYRCKKIISSEEALNGMEGVFELSYLFQGTSVVQKIIDTTKAIMYTRTKTADSGYGQVCVELIKPMSIENFLIEPSAFEKLGYYYSANIDIIHHIGHEITNNTVPMLVLAKASQMVAYECNLCKDIELVDGVLMLKAGSRPSTTIQGNLVLMGV